LTPTRGREPTTKRDSQNAVGLAAGRGLSPGVKRDSSGNARDGEIIKVSPSCMSTLYEQMQHSMLGLAASQCTKLGQVRRKLTLQPVLTSPGTWVACVLACSTNCFDTSSCADHPMQGVPSATIASVTPSMRPGCLPNGAPLHLVLAAPHWCVLLVEVHGRCFEWHARLVPAHVRSRQGSKHNLGSSSCRVQHTVHVQPGAQGV
jgi:hypothetical protein